MNLKLASVLIGICVFLSPTAPGWQRHAAAEPPASFEPGDEPSAVLRPSVAGSFYPGDADVLRKDIEGYLKAAKLPEIDGEIVAAVVPHAGYIYSGPVAAHAYRAIGEQAERHKQGGGAAPEAVVILAFSHRVPYSYVSVYYKGAVKTPLGQAAVAEAIARELMDSDPRLSFSERVFSGEHSMEVQIPFLQTVLPDVPVVPVIFGRQNLENIEAVSKALEKLAEKHRILVVATTDLSHHTPYEKCNALDKETTDMILKGDPRKMAQYASENSGRMCGPAPLLSALSFAKSQGAEPVLLKYANSGDTSGKKDAVVGYAAVVFVKRGESEAGDNSAERKTEEETEEYLTKEDRDYLLGLARRSIESVLIDRKQLVVEPPSSERLRENGAAFVTLRKDGRLCGCIGRLEAETPLYKTVIYMAAAAATQDRRFRPVRPQELDEIHVEVSVNTPLRPVSGPEEIVLGKHGVVVSKGFRQGVYLPHVATETGWSKEQFLGSLCRDKAGLAPDAYKNGAQLYVFTSIVFEEER